MMASTLFISCMALLAHFGVRQAMAGSPPSDHLWDTKLYEHNDTHSMLHLNHTELGLHDDFLVANDVLQEMPFTAKRVTAVFEGHGEALTSRGTTSPAAPLAHGETSLSLSPKGTSKEGETPATTAAIYEHSAQPSSALLSSPTAETVDSPAAAAEPASPSPAAAGVTTARLEMTDAAQATEEDSASLETSSSEEDEDEDDAEAPPTRVNASSVDVEDREAEMAATNSDHRWKVTTFTVVMCAVVSSVFVIMVGVWIRRMRRFENRRLLEEDDEEFTVFNVIDHHYPARKVDQYSPLP
ncbi:uncharacterized protein LOC119090029 [Pollicipes pollicipes]|uniref:uncharacterized protein LOC119090029 n=1 Tax=Pollicipes pollicipes TaxID=41117 RepID=UPI0018852DE2|nr:uncharacterized protein LOC119090029 [Pollicipes pollicipes]